MWLSSVVFECKMLWSDFKIAYMTAVHFLVQASLSLALISRLVFVVDGKKKSLKHAEWIQIIFILNLI